MFDVATGLKLCNFSQRAVLQNKTVMALGLLAITLSVGYLGYMHAMKENDQQLYEAIDSQGERYMKRKTSRWD